MKIIALTLATIGSLGAVALGGRAIATDRTAVARRAPVADSAPATPAGSAEADRVWYGGTLPPIVVVADAPAKAHGRVVRDCPAGGD